MYIRSTLPLAPTCEQGEGRRRAHPPIQLHVAEAVVSVQGVPPLPHSYSPTIQLHRLPLLPLFARTDIDVRLVGAVPAVCLAAKNEQNAMSRIRSGSG